MVSRHQSAKIIASFHCMLDVFCRSCGLVYYSGSAPLFIGIALMWYHVYVVVVGCTALWEHA